MSTVLDGITRFEPADPDQRIPLCVPSVGPAEEASVLMALRSGWVAPAGPQLQEFEAELAVLTDRPAVVAVSSGTAALHLSLLAAGIGAGDSVAVSTLTFAATANAISYVGARPVFIDCDATGLMSAELLAEALERHGSGPESIRAVMPVDLYGRMADLPAITAVAQQWGAVVISDAAESLGAVLDGRPAGSFGSFAALSFNGNKIITTSSGGAVLCPDVESADRVRYLAAQARQPVSHYEHTEVGYNYRLSNLLAALGLAQLGRLPAILRAKREHADEYARLAQRHAGVELLAPGTGNCWMTAIVLDSDAGIDACALGESLASVGIETRRIFKPMHLQPLHAAASRDFITGRAEHLFEHGLVLPSSTDLDPVARARVIAAIDAALDVIPVAGERRGRGGER